MEVRISPAEAGLHGEISVPSDKSISHRAVLFAGMAEGTSLVSGILDSADVRATLSALHWLGAGIRVLGTRPEGLFVEIRGWGDRGPVEPLSPVECGNSGTTVRLLMGALAGWPVRVTLTGDSSLSSRPMRRVADPLEAMGASVRTTASGTLPATIRGGVLRPIDYVSPVASAQVKTAVILAGLRAEGTTRVTEPARSRDHTERMLPAFGVPVEWSPESLTVSVSGPVVPTATDLTVPGDPSSAAFFAVAGVIVHGSTIVLNNVLLNPTRTGFLRVLERMGARIEVSDADPMGTERVGTIVAHAGSPLSATVVRAEEVPTLVDEVPILALAATQAKGTTRFEGIGELRVKESDRLEAVRAGLAALGATVEAGEDLLEVTLLVRLHGATLPSLGDHRLAMTWC
ncbi:3-phosphoshikimate 1-carboxyvinyltransferase, partial [bacterium]|nr:3-phosphoshikimate 1-carboxyvinyltransferase [bacterium]